MIELYQRAIWPVRDVDGDTLDYLEDDGRRSYAVRRERTLGINAPEIHAPDPAVRQQAAAAAAEAVHWFTEHLPCNKEFKSWPRLDGSVFSGYVEVPYFLLDSRKPDSFDRWLSVITCQAGHSLGQHLLDLGLAVPFVR